MRMAVLGLQSLHSYAPDEAPAPYPISQDRNGDSLYTQSHLNLGKMDIPQTETIQYSAE